MILHVCMTEQTLGVLEQRGVSVEQRHEEYEVSKGAKSVSVTKGGWLSVVLGFENWKWLGDNKKFSVIDIRADEGYNS